MSPWQTVFNKARDSSAWKGIFPARRETILYTRDEQLYGDRWVIRDLWIDLQKDVAERLSAAAIKPKTISIFADVVYAPANFSATLQNMALIIVARRIEAEDQATIRLDYSNSFGATILLYTAEIGGKLQAESVTSTPALIPITVPQKAGLWIKYDFTSKQAKGTERAKLLESKSFEKGSPLWLMAVSAFQMATALVTRGENEERTPEEDRERRGKASQMLDFVLRCAKDVPSEKKDSVADWEELAKESNALKKVLADSAARDAGIECARLFARLLNQDTPAHERERRLNEERRASSERNEGPSYELLEAKLPPPQPEDIKYIRHGAQTIGTKELNGWNRPVRQVTLSGVEIELDGLDRSGFLKEYSGKQDIQELHIHADTLVIKTRVHFPQTNVFVHCRELYFEGAEACIDTQPVASEYRASLDKDGRDGVKAGDIRLLIRRFGTTEKEGIKHFRAIGGKGQEPDEGEIELSYTLRHLPLLTKAEWDSLFTYTNRGVGNTTVAAPDWDKYKDYHPAVSDDGKMTGIVYAEIKVNGRIIDKKGAQDTPGTGGKGPTPGRPGSGGPGGDIYGTVLDDLVPYVDVSGGASGAPISSTKGGAGGTPDIAYWFLFENKDVDGKIAFVPTIEKKEAETGPAGTSGPAAFKAKGEDGGVKPFSDTPPSSWVTSINLKSALQFAKDALAGGNTGLARESLMPYLDALEKRPAEKKDDTLLHLEGEASALAEQAIQNVDYFGNPPGWVPMLALESAVQIYQNILKSSMQEIYTAYYLQKAWEAKADRQEALQSLVGLLTKSTETAQKSLITTRANVIKTMQSLKQLNVEIEEKLLKPLKVIEDRLRDEADAQTDKAARLQIISAAFKIFGAVAKAIPLPEPYQMAAGAVGTVFDITGEFIAEEGPTDKAFAKLKSDVNGFLDANTDNIIKQSEKSLDESLQYAKKDIKELQAKAEAASKEKEGLQDTYDAKKKEHDALIKTEKEKLEAMREKLLYGRGSRKKEMVTWMEKEFKDFEQNQNKKLKDATGDYQAQDGKVKKIQSEIEGKEKKLKASQAEVDKEKKVNAELVKTGIKQVKNIAAGAETVAKTINELMVSRLQLNSTWDKTLAKLTTDDKEFQEVSRQLAAVNQRKTAVATELFALKASLRQQGNLISNNLLSVNVLSSQLGSSKDALDPMALAYVQSIGHEAQQSLMQFLYYVGKAYEYYMVEPGRKLDYGAQKLFESLQNVLDPADPISGIEDLNEDQEKKLRALLSKPVSFKANVLTQEEFNLLKIVYEKPLRDMGKRLANQLASGSGVLLKETPKSVTLGREQLQELNTRIDNAELENTMPLSLTRLRQIDQTSEKQRIGNIKVVKVQCKKLGGKFPDSVTFKIGHRGKSVVRARGKLFAFEPEGGPEEERGQRSRVIFTTTGGKTADADWLLNGDTGTLHGKTLWQPTIDRQQNLLTQFLKSDAGGETITLSEFRPGVFSEFEMTVEIRPPESKIEMEEIQLQITTEAGDAPKGQTIVCVSTHPELAIPITTSVKDISDRSGGLGSYTGIFKDLSRVRISVPERFGNYVHTGWCVDGENKPDNGQHDYEIRKSSYLVANFERGDRLFRKTKGIVSDFNGSDPKKEADVIITAAALGFAASYIQKDVPIQFDMDPLEGQDQSRAKAFNGTVDKIDTAIADYLKKNEREPAGKVHAGLSPGYTQGAVIVGVYKLAGQSAPPSISAPVLSARGRALYDKIKNADPSIVQYTGRGAYTGFVDNHNTVENTDPVGPRPTARFLASTDSIDEKASRAHPRWLPAQGSAVWESRKRKGRPGSYVPWGLIMGDAAGKDPAQPNATGAKNLADQTTIEMRDKYGMVFNGEPDMTDIATYTHGMIQAIYKAYTLGPSCTPYEIAVGEHTKKMASCLPCTLFMVAAGYPPTSTHLGRGESWAPLHQSYNPGAGPEANEAGVIRDLNNRWYEKCAEFVTLGLEILDDEHIAEDHKISSDAVRAYLRANKANTVAGTLLLDALTMHDGEADRINRTLKGKSP